MTPSRIIGGPFDGSTIDRELTTNFEPGDLVGFVVPNGEIAQYFYICGNFIYNFEGGTIQNGLN